jgi:serine/threonine protein kinase/Tol biopolymer transport system component
MTLERDYLLKERYRILEILGQGGMGAVYIARDENLGVEVAVKENFFTSDEYSRQFRREATILATMRHPNLPRVSDHFEVEEQGQYMVMDYIEGEDLRQRMDRLGPIPDEEVIVIGAAICDALQYLHTRQPSILHRDIKPGNIKISPTGAVYLVDFGLAKIVKGTQATTTGARAMTPGYSSPEQYGTARTDERSDIYSLGATLYAALTNTIPEDGLARAMEQADLTPVRKRNPRVSRRLAIVIEKSLEVHPEDRYQSAEEFKLDLLQASTSTKQLQYTEEMTVPPPPPEVIEEIAKGKGLESTGATTPPISGVSRTRARRLRWRRLRRALLTVLVLLIGGAAIWFQVGMPGKEALFKYIPTQWSVVSLADQTTEPTASATITPTDQLEAPTSTPTETSTPTAIVPTDTPDPSATETLIPSPTFTATRTATLPGGTATSTLIPLPGQMTPTPTPNGFAYPLREEQIAFASARSGSVQIWLYAIDGGFLQQLTYVEGGACQPNWSPDGRRIAFISPCTENKTVYLNSNIYVLDLDTAEISELPLETGSFDPTWAPDGNSILYVHATDLWTTSINRLELESGEIELMTGGVKLNVDPAWSPSGDRIVFVSTRSDAYYLYLMPDEPGFNPIRLTYSENRKVLAPTWSINQEIVFTDGPLDSFVYLMKVSPEMAGVGVHQYSETRLDFDGEYYPEVDPDFNDNGMWLAFESWVGNANHDIYLMRYDGGLTLRITTSSAIDFDPVWRPYLP